MTTNGLTHIRVETDKVSYVIGEPVKFSLFQKNTGNEPVHGGIGTIDVYIYNSKGECVYGLSCDLDWLLDFKIMPMEEVELLNVLPAWHQASGE